MNQTDKRIWLINALLKESIQYEGTEIPDNPAEQAALLRSLMNVREASPVSQDFIEVQDAYLREETQRKGITDCNDLTPVRDHLYLWQGDITTLRCDAIVNAANSGMTGCYVPCHGCIDNCIHTYSGIQLRNECARIMKQQGHAEPTGGAKITPAYNLPCRFVLHTVGPIVTGPLTREKEEQLTSCYRACLALAKEHHLESVAFCCISTGEFHFPNRRAAEIAVETVTQYGDGLKVIFNVWKDIDYEIYKEYLR